MKRCIQLFMFCFIVFTTITLQGCSATDVIKSVVSPPAISANVGDNRIQTDVAKQKAISIDEIDGENIELNTNVKQNENNKNNSLDNASANTIVQNNDLPWYAWLIIGLCISLDALIESIKSIFTRRE